MFRRLLFALVVAASITTSLAPVASADRTFSVRYASTQNGSTRLVANTLMTCSGSGSSCANARAGTNNNNNGPWAQGVVATPGIW